MYELKTKTHFDSAHFLTDYYGKCENLHGHRWEVCVHISVNELQKDGTMKDMVLDFGVFKQVVKEVAFSLDHTFLVEKGSLKKKTLKALKSEGFKVKILPFRTTAENLAKYFFERLEKSGVPVTAVEMYETPNNCAIYRSGL